MMAAAKYEDHDDYDKIGNVIPISEGMKKHVEEIDNFIRLRDELFPRDKIKTRNDDLNKIIKIKRELSEYRLGESHSLLERCFNISTKNARNRTVVLGKGSEGDIVTFGNFGLGTKGSYEYARSRAMSLSYFERMRSDKRDAIIKQISKIDEVCANRLKKVVEILKLMKDVEEEEEKKFDDVGWGGVKTLFKFDEEIRCISAANESHDDAYEYGALVLKEEADNIDFELLGKDEDGDVSETTPLRGDDDDEGYDIFALFERMDLKKVVEQIDTELLEKKKMIRSKIEEEFRTELALADL